MAYARLILAPGPHAAAATARSSCRVAGASGSWWRIVVAQAATEVHEGEVAAEQMSTHKAGHMAVADKHLIMSRIMICPVWFC